MVLMECGLNKFDSCGSGGKILDGQQAHAENCIIVRLESFQHAMRYAHLLILLKIYNLLALLYVYTWVSNDENDAIFPVWQIYILEHVSRVKYTDQEVWQSACCKVYNHPLQTSINISPKITAAQWSLWLLTLFPRPASILTLVHVCFFGCQCIFFGCQLSLLTSFNRQEAEHVLFATILIQGLRDYVLLISVEIIVARYKSLQYWTASISYLMAWY